MMQSTVEAYRRVTADKRRDELILAHLPLVRHIVGRLLAELPPGMDRENLESAGTLGLVEAAGQFDPSHGVEFASFARHRIRGAVLDELRRNCPLPQQMLEHAARVRKALGELPQPVTVAGLAAATRLSRDEVTDCLAAMRLLRMAPAGDAELRRVPSRDAAERPDAAAERAEQKRLLAEAIAALGERDRVVVTLYYLEDLRLKEIGRLVGLSESRTSRVLNAALFQMREHIRARETGV